jgi:hypothetical protein
MTTVEQYISAMEDSELRAMVKKLRSIIAKSLLSHPIHKVGCGLLFH